MKIVEVTWLDAQMEDAHMDEGGVKNLELIKRKNVGYLLRCDDVVIVSFGTISDDIPKYDDHFVIPHSTVTEIRFLDDEANNGKG